MALHEAVHVWQYGNNVEYSNYESVVLQEIDPTCEVYRKMASQINDNHYNGRYDIEDINSFEHIIRELTAYISQYVCTNPKFAREKFAGMFENWENVVQAVYKMNDKLGFYDIRKEANLEYEVAFLNSNETQTNEIDTDEFIKGLHGEDDSDSEVLQSTADGVVDSENDFNYNDNSIKEGENYNGEDTKLLERGAVPAAYRGNDVLWQQGTNPEKFAVGMEISQRTNGAFRFTKRTGKSGWLDERKNITGEKTRKSFDASILRRIRGIKLSGKDTVGGTVSTEILERFKNTICKDEKGNLISLYHWTNEIFESFKKGEFGFHFGTLRAAYDRYLQTKGYKQDISDGIYKEVILNITNPIELSEGVGDWNAHWVALQLLEIGIISEQQYNDLSKLSGFNKNTYDNPAAKAVREILAQNGYDGIIYENLSEDAGSYSFIALYPEQIITIAENGVLKENSGVSRAISNEEIASFDSGEKQTNGIDADEFIKGLRGEDDSESFIQNSTNAVTNPLSSYAPEKRGMIIDFLNSVDEKLKAFVERVKNGSNKFERFTISDVSDREAADIKY